jgi:hypothetical protein
VRHASRIAAGIFLAAIALALAVGMFAPASWQTALATGGPGCPFHRATGVDCPFCGMTRATIALGRCDLHGALGFHPFAPLVLAGLIVLLAIVVAGRTDALLRGKRPYVLLGAILAMWIARLVVQW